MATENFTTKPITLCDFSSLVVGEWRRYWGLETLARGQVFLARRMGWTDGLGGVG